jgi:DHA3 family macrolide efflux protein-like MFS transporter
VLIGALVAGLVLGLLARGRLDNLASVRLRLVQALFLGLFLRFATQYAIELGNDPVDALRLPLFGGAFLLLLFGLWANREQPGLPLAFVGILLNAIAMLANAGYMPVWEPAIGAAGLTPLDLSPGFHTLVASGASGAISADFLVKAVPLGDVIPIPVPGLRNVASVGDVLLAGGLAFFLFATTVRTPTELSEAAAATIRRRIRGLAGAEELGYPIEAPVEAAEASGLVSATALQRPVVLGGASVGSEGTFAGAVGAGAATSAVPAILTRVRRHPYVRLALDSSFSALWAGQLISLIGDRVHQVALAFLVLRATESPIAVGVVFLVATLPNLLFAPLAGALVDRWEHREVMIVSDLLRAGIVMLIPIAAVTDLVLVYPMVFLVTTISIFFRPAKLAILPRIVPQEDLVPANSALWVSETFADIGGYFLAGLFVALLGSQLPLAFWVDAVTYVASALLVASIAVAPLVRRGPAGEPSTQGAGTGRRPGRLGVFTGELREGWRFLRADAVLLANTIQAIVGQFMLGIILALTPVFADRSIDRLGVDSSAAYSFLEGAIGAGNLIGGFAIGLIGARLALGKAVIAGYVVTGAMVAAMAASGNLAVAVGLAFGVGVGNLGFVIPSQTLFQRRVPMTLMGRVLSLRFALVFGSMTVAMGVGGVLGEAFGAALVIGVFGLVTMAAGLAGLLVPAVREA